MLEPKQERSLDLLRADFREKLDAWLQAVAEAFPAYTAGVHETLRTPERQQWLWEQGRTRQGPIVTWTLDSNHLHGLAADFHVALNGKAIWDPKVYERVYAAVPPERFGLESLAPTEWVHIQLADADNRRDETPAVPDRLILLLNADGSEAGRVTLPAGADVLTRVSADGTRVYVRPDLTT